jgi:hypothetical protein
VCLGGIVPPRGACAATPSQRLRSLKVFLRVQVLEPERTSKVTLVLKGHRHLGANWYLPEKKVDIPGRGWSEWIDLSDWPWHGKMSRAGGVAEWCSVRLSLDRAKNGEELPKGGCALRVQVADAPREDAVVHDFTEKSESKTTGFLLPTPLRENAKEFETGSQMAARHRAWAEAATGGKPIALKGFPVCTSLWGHYDPGLAREELETLKRLGFNVINTGSGLEPADVRSAGFRLYHQEWLFESDPRKATKKWEEFARRRLESNLRTPDGRWEFVDGVSHWVIGDEVRTLSVMGLDRRELDDSFRAYLKETGVVAREPGFFGRPLNEVEYPADELHDAKTLPRDADLPHRRLLYHAAKFGQWWSAKQLRHTSDLIHGSLPGSKTETLPTDHGFFNAGGQPPEIGMSWKLLDYFELGRQRSVDQLAAEDWLGLNHMYGPNYTWTGAQSHEYLTAVMRSAVADDGVTLRNLITPSDDKYLRLKAYSALGQGSKSFFFWTYGPTYIATENYWSDLRSMYDGIAKLTRAFSQAEDTLHDATVVRDPVAILYSVSHDIWNSDQPAAFVEKRLLWHALRHLGIQPDFLSEQDVEAGRLKDYKALYVVDWCLTRAASARIDEWVKAGGVAYVSAGAATRDEYDEPYVPGFAAPIWGSDARDVVGRFVAERHAYNERADLPDIKAIATVELRDEAVAAKLPVIGCRLDLGSPTGSADDSIATFADGKPAGVMIRHGKGTVIGLGFCPMLGYGQMAGFKPKTLEERWPAAPRRLAQLALDRAGVKPVARADVPVVETSLLKSKAAGSYVLVLANYTYQPIPQLHVDVRIPGKIGRVISTEGRDVKVESAPGGGVRLTLPLDWTDLLIVPEAQ